MSLLDISIPIITFFLGSIFTLFMKNRESKRETINQNTNEICDLVNVWYNQIHAIFVDLKYGKNISELDKEIYTYNHNRLVLPKLIRNIEILKQYKGTNNFVEHVELFLELVTNIGSRSSENEAIFCEPFYKTFYTAIFNNDLMNNSKKEQIKEDYLPSISDTLKMSKLDLNHLKCAQSRVSEALSNSIELKKSELYENCDSLLMELDCHIQRINKEAAKLLK